MHTQTQRSQRCRSAVRQRKQASFSKIARVGVSVADARCIGKESAPMWRWHKFSKEAERPIVRSSTYSRMFLIFSPVTGGSGSPISHKISRLCFIRRKTFHKCLVFLIIPRLVRVSTPAMNRYKLCRVFVCNRIQTFNPINSPTIII